MARYPSPPGESKTPLIVGLVVSVLLTLTLGVLYYMSFDENKQATEAKKTAETEKASIEKKLRAEQEKVKLYRVMLGTGTEEDVTALKNTSEKADVTAEYQVTAKQLQDRLSGYNAQEAAKSPGQTFKVPEASVFDWPAAAAGTFDAPPTLPLFQNVVRALGGQVLATRRQATAEAKLADEVKNYQTKVKAADDATKALRDAAAKFPAEVQAAVAVIQKNYTDATQNFTTQNSEYTRILKDEAVAKEQAVITAEQADAKAKQLARRVTLAEAEELGRADPFAYQTPHGKVTSNRNGTITINLGSADNVRRGLKFNVQPADTPTRGLDSRKVVRQLPGGETVTVVRDKAKIEVLDVLGPSVSTAQIIEQENPIRDAILPGDVLYNAVWRKGVPDRIALFGLFDIDADGVDDTKAMIKDLQQVGVAVDAYFDLEKGEWVGKYNQQTALAVEGYYPVSTGADALSGAKSALIQKLTAVRAQLLGDGIRVVKARDFFPRTGYKMRLDITPDLINRAYNRYLSTAPAAPAEPKN